MKENHHLTLNLVTLEYRCSVNISAVVEMFYICVIQYDSHLWLLST